MTCIQVQEELVAYMKGEIVGERGEEMAAHLRVCDGCQKERERMSRVLAALSGASQPTIIQKVNDLLNGAMEAGASDLHLEPTPEGLKVRVRIDGVLYDREILPHEQASAVTARLKEMGDLDVMERQRPQEGRIHLKHQDQRFDVRLSCIPVVGGERVVARFLDHPGTALRLDHLGLSEDQRQKVESLLTRPWGLILITGPGGSGKTTLAYALLQALVERCGQYCNLLTVESPCETWLPGVSQMVVNRRAGMTYAEAIRAVMRQDPDVLMVGDMDHAETAQMGLNAALTGHLVIGVMSVPDVLRGLERLQGLGIEAVALGVGFIGGVSLRLMRKVCSHCAAPCEYPPSALKRFHITEEEARQAEFKRGKGCEQCHHTGFRGRTGLFEVLVADEEFSRLLIESPPDPLRQRAFPDGAGSLWEDARKKVLAGITTPDEALRVLLTR